MLASALVCLLPAALTQAQAQAQAQAQTQAQDSAKAEASQSVDAEIIVSAARSNLPPSALPLTIDVIAKEALDTQVRISGSVVDAVARKPLRSGKN
jgi:iron complex outermembrane receptor protein